MSAPNTIQRGSATMLTSESSITVTITSITTSKAFLVYTTKGGNDCVEYDLVDGWISGSTQLTFQRLSIPSAGTSITIRWEVIEYPAGVATQRGAETNIQNINRDVTITSVNTAKSWARTNIKTQYNDYIDSDTVATANITSSTNLRLKACEASSYQQTVRWEVVEYADCSVQKIEQVINGTSTTATITSVTVSKSMLVLTYRMLRGDYDFDSDTCWQGYISAATTVQFNRTTDDGTNTDTVCLYVVSFTDSTVVRQYNNSMASGTTSVNTTITSIDLDKSYVMPGNVGPNNTSLCLTTYTTIPRCLYALYLSAATTANASRTSSGTATGTNFRFEVVSYEQARRSFIPFISALTGGH